MRRFEREWVVVPKYKLLMPLVFKAASRTIFKLLRDVRVGGRLVRGARPEGTEDYFVAACVRHPAARARSFWAQKLCPRRMRLKYFPDLPAGWDEYVDWLNTPEGSDARADQHWISQSLVVPRWAYTFRMERFHEGWNNLCDQVGMRRPQTIPVANCTGSTLEPTEGQLAALGRRYHRDYVRFGYQTFELDP